MQHFLDTWTARVVELDKQWLSSPMFHNACRHPNSHTTTLTVVNRRPDPLSAGWLSQEVAAVTELFSERARKSYESW